MREMDPNSPIARAKAKPKPPSTAGQIEGSTTVKNIRTLPAPKGARGRFALEIQRREDGLHRSHREREGDKQQGHHQTHPGFEEVDVNGAVDTVDREEHDARDNGRQREGQVDRRLEETFAGKVVANENPRDRVTPMTELIAATLSESHSDKKMASFEPDAVTAFQNVRAPMDTCQRQNSAPAP